MPKLRATVEAGSTGDRFKQVDRNLDQPLRRLPGQAGPLSKGLRGLRGLSSLTAVLLVFSACGPEPLTKAQFIERGDRLCRRFEREARAVRLKTDPFQPGASPADLQSTPRFLDFFAANLPQLAGNLRGLGPPADDRILLDRTVRILDDSGRQFALAKQAFQKGDHAAAKATLDRAFGRLEQAARSAEEYGFKNCGAPATQSGGPSPGPPGPEVPVAATEYVFQMSPELPPGPHTFVIKNDGRERHFLSLTRLKPGIGFERLIDSERAGEPTAELIEQAIGQSDTTLPGETVRLNADLPPGNYAYACFIAAPDGQLHAYKGMAGQLSVKQP